MPSSPPSTDTPTDDLPFRLVRRGKVRDVYELPPTDTDTTPRLLLVASDRISAFDVVLPTPIPDKGRILTSIAESWFRFIEDHRIAQTHLISTNVDDLAPFSLTPDQVGHLRGRITIGHACRVIPVECVVRGYLEGSGWREYQDTGSVCGVSLPAGLSQCDKLPEPIFTPATKAAEGHDENISFEAACDIAGLEEMTVLRDLSLRIYKTASAHALSRGIIIADTKFEFGILDGDEARAGRTWTPPILIDEALTPDSSRFWPADDYEPGRAQRSFDKQFVREYLQSLVDAGAWDKSPPGPTLPDDVVEGTRERYDLARTQLWGE